ncbi:MAG TPA: DUF1993 domain-containing protein [Steroidobacteraceae bacterium]|nr:DUF1993 domain-containing protein [Steroidobacteraceae bacterium]
MTFSLYAATVPSYRQILGAVAGLLRTAHTYCAEKNVAPADLLQARLAPDMFPFTQQVMMTVGHSIGAIEGIRKGVFTPDTSPPPDSLDELAQRVDGALEALARIEPAEIDAFLGRDMLFAFRDRKLPFTAEDYLLSFAQPNFYFHATTAYDILRWKGLPIGKRDYIGRLRLKS